VCVGRSWYQQAASDSRLSSGSGYEQQRGDVGRRVHHPQPLPLPVSTASAMSMSTAHVVSTTIAASE